MTPIDPDDQATLSDADAEGTRPLSVLVVGDHTVASHPLPARGTVVIGRSPGVDIQVPAPWISRRHASLHVEGSSLRVTDLGSANGTRVRETKLPSGGSTHLEPGDVLELGSTLLVVQRTRSAEPPRLRTESYFEARLAEECTRAQKYSLRFALLTVAAAPEQDPVVAATLSSIARAVDVVARVGPGEHRCLLVNGMRAEAELAIGRVVRQLATRGVSARTAVACFPTDGEDPGALLAVTRRSLGEGARQGQRGLREQPFVWADEVTGHVVTLADRCAPLPVHVLLVGEPGTGKTAVAERIHGLSTRREGPFVRLACGALTGAQIEAELFGHGHRPGLFEAADGGTLFLDDPEGLSDEAQAKLHHAMVHGEVFREGGVEPHRPDVRCIAATRRSLADEVARHHFSADLLQVLSGVTLTVPPLRQRPADIEPLANHFLRGFSEASGREPPVLSAEALQLLLRHTWPGNIRELRAAIERGCVLCGDGPILPAHLPLGGTVMGGGDATLRPPAVGSQALLKDEVDRVERHNILTVLEQCGGNQSRAAKVLGISRNTLIARLKAYGVLTPKK